jgi:hypothetical protein
MTFSIRFILVFLFSAFHLLSLSAGFSIASPQAVVFAIEIQEEDVDSDDEDDDEDEFEDDEDFTNNPWRVDERKLFAAKKFMLTKEFSMKMKQIDDLCGLDKKQALKLKVASKGAVEKALEKYIKGWKEQIQQFGNFQVDDEDDEENKKKKKRKKKRKRFVVNKVEDIDAQTMQMLDNSFMGGVQKGDYSKVAIWTRTIKKVLTEDQRKRLEEHRKKLILAKGNARADSFVAAMRLKVAISDEQLEEFDKLVRPAFLKKDYDVTWQYEHMATLYLGSKHNKKKMQELLSKEQYLVLKIALKQAENYAGLFGDNAVAQRNVVVAADPMFGIFGGVFDALEEMANFVGESVEGALNWLP